MSEPLDHVNDAARTLIEVLRTADPPPEEAQAAADLIARARAILEPHVVDAMRMQAGLRISDIVDRAQARVGSGEPLRGEVGEFFTYSPIVGLRNPISPPARMWVVPGDPYNEVHGSGSFPTSFNGPPDSVHGGFVAAILDDLLGATCVANDLGGFTGTLTVVYRSPTPIHTEITMAARIDRIERRKVFAVGELYHGDTLLAEGSGIFIRAADSTTGPGSW